MKLSIERNIRFWGMMALMAGSLAGCQPSDESSAGGGDATDATDMSDSSDPSDVTDSSDSTAPSNPGDLSFSIAAELLPQGISGLQEIEVRTTMRGSNGEPLSGLSVLLNISPADSLILLSQSESDEAGVAKAVFLANSLGEVVIAASTEIDGVSYQIGETRVSVESGQCLSSRDYFETRLWGPVIQQCSSCHNSMGRALEINPYVMTFPFDGEADFLSLAYDQLVAKGMPMDTEDFGELPMYVAKPLGVYHGGGEIIEADSDEFHLLKGLSVLTKLEAAGHQCEPLVESDIFAQVTYKSDLEVMAQAKQALTGTPLDVTYFESRDPSISLEDELSGFLNNPPQPAFGNRIKDIFNDILQVRSFEPGLKNAAIQLRGYNQFYFFECATENSRNCCRPENGPCCATDYPDEPEFCAMGAQRMSYSAVESSLETIRYVVENDLPFENALTFDKPMVNPIMAKVYGVEPVTPFEDPYDPTEWRFAVTNPVHVDNGQEIQHSGFLSNGMFLARYPSSNSNANRARARWVFENLLGVDVMGLAKFEIKLGDELTEIPTLNDVGCSSCHALLDPVAGGFKNWRNKGNYNDRYRWTICDDDFVLPGEEEADACANNTGGSASLCYREPGFDSDPLPESEDITRLNWLGEQVSDHHLYGYAIARLIHRALVRDEILTPPSDLRSEDYKAEWLAYRAQVSEFQRLASIFRASNHTIKSLIQAVVLGPYYRAADTSETDPTILQALRLARIGTANPLSPEQLHTRIEATLGYAWTNTMRDTGIGMLTSTSQYEILYGGIDNDQITERATDATQMMHNIARHMSARMACFSVSQDFSYTNPQDRKLFQMVEAETIADTSENAALIRDTIRYLHLRFLNEEVSEAELEIAFNLFVAAAEVGVASNENPANRLNSACEARSDYFRDSNNQNVNLNDLENRERIVRDETGALTGWIAVLTYLLSDYAFLYE